MPDPRTGPEGDDVAPATSEERAGGQGAEVERLRGEVARLRSDLAAAEADAVRWRAAVIDAWVDSVAGGGATGSAALLQEELDAIRATVSWRLTAPLRAVRRRTIAEG